MDEFHNFPGFPNDKIILFWFIEDNSPKYMVKRIKELSKMKNNYTLNQICLLIRWRININLYGVDIWKYIISCIFWSGTSVYLQTFVSTSSQSCLSRRLGMHPPLKIIDKYTLGTLQYNCFPLTIACSVSKLHTFKIQYFRYTRSQGISTCYNNGVSTSLWWRTIITRTNEVYHFIYLPLRGSSLFPVAQVIKYIYITTRTCSRSLGRSVE